jgi:hypothetical protein
MFRAEKEKPSAVYAAVQGRTQSLSLAQERLDRMIGSDPTDSHAWLAHDRVLANAIPWRAA